MGRKEIATEPVAVANQPTTMKLTSPYGTYEVDHCNSHVLTQIFANNPNTDKDFKFKFVELQSAILNTIAKWYNAMDLNPGKFHSGEMDKMTALREDISLIGVEVPWLPPRCSHCCIFGHAENLCKVGHEPSKVWIPKASIATDDVVKGKRIVTSKDVDIASSSMGCVLPVAGNVTGENNGLGVTTYNVGIVLDSSSDQGVRDLVTQGVVLGLDLASLYGEVVHDVAGSVAQGVVDKVVQGAADYAQVQVSAIVLDVGAATQDVVGVELANAPTDIGVVVAFDGTDGSPKQIREVAKGVVDLVQEIKNAKRNGKKGRKKGVGNNPSHS
ncbi:hypothetical protein V6N12_059308 [Hibiscus sabdariffa]|uniref:Uncharacterized protein n=1 Tax=Hibiscus sabdariffa TaxID=183260 RepID=A0ABR2EUQ8_9ROSI